MHRVDTATAIAALPSQNAAGTPGYFSQGDSSGSPPATVPGPDWFNSVQEELIGIVLAAGMSPSKSNNAQLITAIKHVAVAPGTVSMFAGAVAPSYWVLCDGAAVSRTVNAGLFAAIGTLWGAGDGTTTFNLPDLRGRMPVGVGTGPGLTTRSLASSGGEEAHSLTAAENGPHTHTTSAYSTGGSGTQSVITADAVTHTRTIDSSGSGTPHNTMPPFRGINFIIKT